MHPSEALSALDAKRNAERSLAAAAVCPPWRHAVFGLMMGVMVASPVVPLPYRFIVLGLALAIIPIIVRSDRKRTGVFINGYRKGRTRFITFAMLAVELALYSISVLAMIANGNPVTPVVLGIAGAAIGTLGSIQWQRIFVRELDA